MDVKQLQRFVAVAQARSFTIAADELAMSQPALSQSIAALERELGRTLLERNKKVPGAGVQLTPGGATLFADAVEILAAVERAVSRVQRAADGTRTQSVVIGFSPGTPRRFVDASLAPAGASDALNTVALQLEWGREQDALERGVADLALLQYPSGTRLQGYDLTALGRFATVALLPASHRLAGRSSIAIRELGGEPILDPGFEAGPPGFRAFWLGLPRPADAPLGEIVGPPNRTIEEMYSFVAAGRGMALTSAIVPRQYQRSDVVDIEVSDLPPVEVGLAKRADDRREFVARLLAAIVADPRVASGD